VKARIAAYGGYQLRDYFAGRALVTVMATVAAAWGYGASRGLTLSAFDSAAGIEARNQLQQAFEFTLAAFSFVAAAVAAQGLIGRHRSRGYDRLLFSRPLKPVRYYSQGFILAGIGAVALAVAGTQLYAVTVHPVSVLGAAGYVALTWVTLGGLAFLLSAVTAFHTPVLAILVGADLALDRYAAGLRATGGGSVVVDAVSYLLPPAHVLAALRDPFARGGVVDVRLLAWPLSFGLACLLVAMFLLRRRPFRT
jgi:hypothetical protein